MNLMKPAVKNSHTSILTLTGIKVTHTPEIIIKKKIDKKKITKLRHYDCLPSEQLELFSIVWLPSISLDNVASLK